jgi:hypothetical protein
MVFLADGAEAHIENNVPFGIAGDDPAGDYNAWADAIGTHTVTITPYDAADGVGTPGRAFIATFTLR